MTDQPPPLPDLLKQDLVDFRHYLEQTYPLSRWSQDAENRLLVPCTICGVSYGVECVSANGPRAAAVSAPLEPHTAHWQYRLRDFKDMRTAWGLRLEPGGSHKQYYQLTTLLIARARRKLEQVQLGGGSRALAVLMPCTDCKSRPLEPCTQLPLTAHIHHHITRYSDLQVYEKQLLATATWTPEMPA